MKKSTFFTILFNLLYTAITAQVHKPSVSEISMNIDSLNTIVNTGKDDTAKVNACHMLGSFTAGTDALAAIEYCKKGAALGKKLDYKKGIAVCMLTASYCYGLLNNLNASINYIDSAIFYYKIINKPDLIALCYKNRAENKQKLGKLKQALNDCDTSMYYTEISNRKSAKKSLYKIMAAIYYAQNNYAQSKIFYEKAYAAHELINDLIPMADILNQLGNIYEKEKQYDLSIRNYEKAIKIALEIKQENNLSEYHRNLSKAWLRKGDKKKAEINAIKAIEYAKAKKNKLQLAAAQTMLSTVYLNKDSTAAAIHAASESFELSANLESKEAQINSAEALAHGYYKKGNYRVAFDYLQISKILSDSFATEKYNDDVAELQTSFKVNEKDKEILLLNKDKALQLQEIKQQQILMLAAGAIVLLSFGGIWLLINRSRLRMKMKELELRNRIAADLHDEVGSSLSSIHMLSHMAVNQGNENKYKEILARMSSNTKETMDKMGDIIWMIKPGETEAGSLRQRMERFAYEICSIKNIGLNLQLNDLQKWKPDIEQRKNVYLLFKEALNNAVKYSDTEKINITAGIDNSILQLEIRDFGKGFRINDIKTGNGLDNMKHRAKELKGELTINSVKDEGTAVVLSVPI
jgi:signal transduction histidine kinase